MPRRVQRHAAAAGQLLVVAQVLVRCRHRGVGHAEHAALHLQTIPEETVVLVQVQGRAGALLHLAGGEEVVEMGMGMNDAHHLQAVLVQARHDQLRIAARIDDDGLLGQRVADDGAVALQRPDGKGFADQGGLGGHRTGSERVRCHHLGTVQEVFRLRGQRLLRNAGPASDSGSRGRSACCIRRRSSRCTPGWPCRCPGSRRPGRG
ncbi:hypothetical protein D3C84_286300 [compost metagenome]